MHPICTQEKCPGFCRGFLLPFDDICNIGELHVFSITTGGHTGGFESVNTKIVCKLLLIKGGIMTDRLAFQDEIYFKGNHCVGCGNENPHGFKIKSYWD